MAAKRQQCRDAGFEPSWRVDGSRYYLSVADMDASLEQAALAEAGRLKYGKADGVSFGSVKAMAFWSPALPPLRSEAVLPSYCRLGVYSAVARGGLAVHVWAYGPVAGLPDGVVLEDAGELVPLERAEELLRSGMCIQHLSDMVRFLAVDRCGWDRCRCRRSGCGVADANAPQACRTQHTSKCNTAGAVPYAYLRSRHLRPSSVSYFSVRFPLSV